MIHKILADISIAEPVLRISSIIALLFSLVFIFTACMGLKQKKYGRSGLFSLISLTLAAVTILVFLASLNILNYQRLNYESLIAEIRFSKIDSQLYRAEVLISGRDIRQFFELRGDEWQLSARIVKWKAPLTLVGFNSLYSLDRFQGRYNDIELERHAPRSVYELNPKGTLDLWTIVQRYKKWLPWIDAYYGSATYLPMTDNSSFLIKLTQSGLIARPINSAASKALVDWE